MDFFYALFETVAMAAAALVCWSVAGFALYGVGRFWLREFQLSRALKRFSGRR